jgi:hypothetical protein
MFRWTRGRTIAVVAVLWVITLSAWWVDRTRVWLDGKFYPTRHRRMLVYDLDHDVIRDACRRMLADRRAAPASTLPSTRSNIGLPPSLAILKPANVSVSPESGYVSVMFGGGFHHWFMDFYENPLQGRGTKDLGNGLWFVDEGDNVPSP